jgi:SAM-dependent methyltransferase
MEHKHTGDHSVSSGSDRGYHRSFDNAEMWAKVDDPARDAWQKPERVLDALRLERTAIIADLGAGTGYFSERIATRVPEGKVFAVDIEPDMVRYLVGSAIHTTMPRLRALNAMPSACEARGRSSSVICARVKA